jgi:hypothetical protein
LCFIYWWSFKGGSVIGKPQHKGNSKFRSDPEVLAYVLHRGFHDSYALFEQKRIQYEMVMLFDSVQTVDWKLFIGNYLDIGCLALASVSQLVAGRPASCPSCRGNSLHMLPNTTPRPLPGSTLSYLNPPFKYNQISGYR